MSTNNSHAERVLVIPEMSAARAPQSGLGIVPRAAVTQWPIEGGALPPATPKNCYFVFNVCNKLHPAGSKLTEPDDSM